MLKNQIKEFYERVLNDVNFQNAMRAFLQEIGTSKATPEVTALVIKEVILPYSRNLGYNFSLKDLLEFETTEKVMVKVPVEELETISGGNAWSTLKRVGNNIYNRLPRKATVFKAMGVAGALIGVAASAYGLYNYINSNGSSEQCSIKDAPKKSSIYDGAKAQSYCGYYDTGDDSYYVYQPNCTRMNTTIKPTFTVDSSLSDMTIPGYYDYVGDTFSPFN